MTPIIIWKRWLIYNLIGEGVHNVLFDDQIRKLSGHNYDENLDIALNSLVDAGVVLRLETNKKKKFVVNYEKLVEAQKILNDKRNWMLSPERGSTFEKNSNLHDNLHQYYSEPEGYSFWFNLEESPRRKKSIYNFYRRKNDDLEFAAQIITQKDFRIMHLGSLRQNHSIISRLWKACVALSNENVEKGGNFILKDLQDKERKACGNNRQRGKIALVIFKELGFIVSTGRKGNSTKYKITGKSPPFSTLDTIIES